MNLNARERSNAKAAALLHGIDVTIKLWEEPDLHLITGDARGDYHSFWAEWLKSPRAPQ